MGPYDPRARIEINLCGALTIGKVGLQFPASVLFLQASSERVAFTLASSWPFLAPSRSGSY